MENITQAIEWFSTNYETIFVSIGMFVTACSTFVAITPSTKDDEFVGKVVKFFELFSVFNKKTK